MAAGLLIIQTEGSYCIIFEGSECSGHNGVFRVLYSDAMSLLAVILRIC